MQYRKWRESVLFNEADIILEAKNITKRFPASKGRQLTACDNVSLNVYKGKTLGIVGRERMRQDHLCPHDDAAGETDRR